jgi:hypothetical protein
MNFSQLYIPVTAAYGSVLLLRLLRKKRLALYALLAIILLMAWYFPALWVLKKESDSKEN